MIKAKRLTLKGFGDYHDKWGRLWAFAKNRPISKLIIDVVEARIEANRNEIEEMIRDIAKQRGITYEELVNEVLSADDED